LKFGIHIMRGIPRRAVEQNLPIAGSKFTAAQAVLPEGDTNRTCVWNRDMFGVDATTEAGRAWYASIAMRAACRRAGELSTRSALKFKLQLVSERRPKPEFPQLFHARPRRQIQLAKTFARYSNKAG
jgi:hypothetical protein